DAVSLAVSISDPARGTPRWRENGYGALRSDRRSVLFRSALYFLMSVGRRLAGELDPVPVSREPTASTAGPPAPDPGRPGPGRWAGHRSVGFRWSSRSVGEVEGGGVHGAVVQAKGEELAGSGVGLRGLPDVGVGVRVVVAVGLVERGSVGDRVEEAGEGVDVGIAIARRWPNCPRWTPGCARSGSGWPPPRRRSAPATASSCVAGTTWMPSSRPPLTANLAAPGSAATGSRPGLIRAVGWSRTAPGTGRSPSRPSTGLAH